MTFAAFRTETLLLTFRRGPKAPLVRVIFLGIETAIVTPLEKLRVVYILCIVEATTVCGAVPTVVVFIGRLSLGNAMCFMFMLLLMEILDLRVGMLPSFVAFAFDFVRLMCVHMSMLLAILVLLFVLPCMVYREYFLLTHVLIMLALMGSLLGAMTDMWLMGPCDKSTL